VKVVLVLSGVSKRRKGFRTWGRKNKVFGGGVLGWGVNLSSQDRLVLKNWAGEELL